MANKWIQKQIEIPTGYTEDERTAIGLEIVRYIRERTLEGKGPGNKSWSGKAGKYSESYIKSLNFRIGRKSKGKVNLKLSGDMLEAITLLDQKRGKIKYGVDEGDSEAGKIEGNVRGTYGNPDPISGKARPFLDLTKEEIQKILSRYPIDDDTRREKRTEAILTSKFASEVLEAVEEDGEE